MSDNNGGHSASLKKIEANRHNAQRSTGPKSQQGKKRSRRNALKHGVLTSALLITKGEGQEDPGEFDELLSELRRDLDPVGVVEDLLVEKIAVCCWRQRRALRCEAGLAAKHLEDTVRKNWFNGYARDHVLLEITEHLTLPLTEDLDRLLRYETTIHRQMAYAMNQLERLQRARKGERVPAPVSVQVSSDQER